MNNNKDITEVENIQTYKINNITKRVILIFPQVETLLLII
jgi:hypothetical protein